MKEATMAVDQTEIALETKAPDFLLPATDGRTYALNDVAGEAGTVIAFICNHCPYVKGVIGRLVADARELMAEGVGFAAICSNDAASYPEDSFPKMGEFARKHDFPFPYLHDETQTSRAPMAPSARPTSSASTGTSTSNIADVSTRAAPCRRFRAHAATFWKRCAPSPPTVRPRRTRSRPSAARSSGGLRGDDERRVRRAGGLTEIADGPLRPPRGTAPSRLNSATSPSSSAPLR
jgi:peroxiredoxin